MKVICETLKLCWQLLASVCLLLIFSSILMGAYKALTYPTDEELDLAYQASIKCQSEPNQDAFLECMQKETDLSCWHCELAAEYSFRYAGTEEFKEMFIDIVKD